LNIAFRIDVNSTIGMGHYMRMSALADAFFELGCTCSFLKSEDEPVDYTGFDIIILDSYQLSDEYIASLNAPGRLLVCYDDNALYNYCCDIVLNANFHAKELAFRLGEKTPKLLLGPYYALLRREFRDTKPVVVKENADHIFVCFGGSDSNNFTPKAIRSLMNVSGKNLIVVLGPYTQCDNEVYNLANDNVKVYKNPDYLPSLIGNSDVAVTASGSMVYELASLGLPTVVITQADNQHNIADYLQRNKLMKWIGDWKNIHPETIKDETENLLKDTVRRETESERLIKTVDRNGALNAAQAILEAAKHEN